MSPAPSVPVIDPRGTRTRVNRTVTIRTHVETWHDIRSQKEDIVVVSRGGDFYSLHTISVSPDMDFALKSKLATALAEDTSWIVAELIDKE